MVWRATLVLAHLEPSAMRLNALWSFAKQLQATAKPFTTQQLACTYKLCFGWNLQLWSACSLLQATELDEPWVENLTYWAGFRWFHSSYAELFTFCLCLGKAWHRSLRLTMVNKEDSSMSLAGLVIGKTCITWRVAESNNTWFCKILSSAPALLWRALRGRILRQRRRFCLNPAPRHPCHWYIAEQSRPYILCAQCLYLNFEACTC